MVRYNRVIKISYYVFLYNTHTVVNSISMTEQLICHLLYTPLVPLPLDQEVLSAHINITKKVQQSHHTLCATSLLYLMPIIMPFFIINAIC